MKQEQPLTERDFDAVRRCFEAYGADLDQWPASKRAAYGALAQSDEMADAREEARLLDGFLNAASAPRPSHELQNVIRAQIDLPKAKAGGEWIAMLFSPMRLIPAGALAGVGALGIAVGAMSETTQAVQNPEYEAIAYLSDTSSYFDGEEIIQWDAE